MSRFEGGPHSLKAYPSAGTDDQNSRHARQCSCRTRHSFVMCDLGSRIARWMGGLNTAAEALIGPDTLVSTSMSAMRTSPVAPHMSAFGARALHMSAFGGSVSPSDSTRLGLLGEPVTAAHLIEVLPATRRNVLPLELFRFWLTTEKLKRVLVHAA